MQSKVCRQSCFWGGPASKAPPPKCSLMLPPLDDRDLAFMKKKISKDMLQTDANVLWNNASPGRKPLSFGPDLL